MSFTETRLISPIQLTTSASSALYTVPTGKSAIIKQIVVTNTTASPATFTFYINGSTSEKALFSGTSVAGNDSVVINLSQVLNSTETINALASANTTLNLTVSGVVNDGPLNPLSTYIADNAITTPKIADASVTTAKIAAGAVVTEDIANNAVTQAKLSTDIPLSGFRNKIINGDMRINQRAATITGSASQQLVTDRWNVYNNAGTVTFQQSTIAPPGYTHSLLATVTATGGYSTAGYTMVTQFIEGFNTADLAWGTASAKPVVVSFWVRSSVIGTYTVSLQNSAQNRSYVATYTVGAANTWEQKTISIPGETTGTWFTDSSLGVRLWFGIGLGTSWETTAGAWQSSNFYSVSGSVDFATNTGATFAITGVQLEQNTQPTPFEQRLYGAELALCQRYYETSNGVCQVTAGATGFGGNTYFGWIGYKVEKRIALPMVTNSTSNGVRVFATDGGADYITYWKSGTQYYSNAEGFEIFTTQGFGLVTSASGQTDAGLGRFSWFANAEI